MTPKKSSPLVKKCLAYGSSMSRRPGGRSVSTARRAQAVSAVAPGRTWPDACLLKRGSEVAGLAILIGPLQHLSSLRTLRRRNNGELGACPDTGIRAARDASGCVSESVSRQHQEAMLTDMMMPGVIQQFDCLVLVNPSAAAVDASVPHEIEGWLSGRARTVRMAWTEAPGHAAELVREHADAGLIIAAGGDGTVAELIQGMTSHQIVCALPVGSGNSTARNLFGDRGWRQVLDLLDDPGAFTVRHLDPLRLLEPGVTPALRAC